MLRNQIPARREGLAWKEMEVGRRAPDPLGPRAAECAASPERGWWPRVALPEWGSLDAPFSRRLIWLLGWDICMLLVGLLVRQALTLPPGL